jgi:hypothetical protein
LILPVIPTKKLPNPPKEKTLANQLLVVGLGYKVSVEEYKRFPLSRPLNSSDFLITANLLLRGLIDIAHYLFQIRLCKGLSFQV